MTLNATVRRILMGLSAVVLVFMYLPLGVVVVNSFNVSQTMTFPPAGLTGEWWVRAWQSEGARAAVLTSVQVAVLSTFLALVLGTLLGLALQRFDFFGKHTVNLLVILPIVLPGVVTGIALNNAFKAIMGVDLGLLTIVVSHATFCIVTVFNNVQARLRRTGQTLEDASADLGAGPLTTFRLVTFPQLRSALLAGGLLAFALSFDEIIVTTFTAGSGVVTLPIWILNNMFRPSQAPVVNVVAVVLIAVSVIPIWIAQRLSGDAEGVR